jgi:hypothetical protein
MYNPPVGWRKVWFFLWNDADVLFPVFTGSCPILQPNWWYGVAQMDLRRLQPLWDIIRGLLQRGLMGAEILWTFLATGTNLFIDEMLPCGCIRGQVISTVPSPWSWAIQRSTPRYDELLLLGPSQILAPALSL